MDDELKPWEPNAEDATQLAHQTSTAVQTLTRLRLVVPHRQL
ncbi:hypothetical protein [Brevibacterium aurantiacum]|nr:hypothetical protein [Brevibacterium aurantiacum]